MNPAELIIEKLGGPSKVSKEVGVHRTRVSNWKRPREAGGTGGVIPQKHIPVLISMARREGIELSAQDFFPLPEAPANDTRPATAEDAA